MKTLIIPLLLTLVMITSCSTFKNNAETSNAITQKVETKNYTLIATEANPMRMKQFHLTSEYDLQIKNDSAFAYLPYFGVAHVAPYNPSEGGIKFKEPMADYTVNPTRKNDGWEIHFKVKSETTRYNVHISIFKNGRSVFTISSYDKDAITFYGEVKE